jgi:hypothetical protein
MHVVKPLLRLHEAREIRAHIQLESMASVGELQKADVALFCRNVESGHRRLLDTALRAQIPVIYDLDDNFFLLPSGTAAAKKYGRAECRAMLEEYLAAADLVRVYSRPIYERVWPLNASVEIVRGVVDGRQLRARPVENSKQAVKIVFATSRLDDTLHRHFVPALAQLQAKRPGQIEVHFWGPKPPAELPGARHRAMIHDYDRYLQSLAEAQFDIGLAPLDNDLFHRSKTDTKFREYGASGVAGIYSAVDVYAAVQDGQTGLIVASNTDAWLAALSRLIDDQTLRTNIQRQARAYVNEHYSPERFDATLLRQITSLADRRALPLIKQRNILSPTDSKTTLRSPPIFRVLASTFARLRNHRIDRTWNSVRWLATSCWKLAYVRYKLRD